METRGGTLNPVENSFVTLFPSMLPWIKPPSQKSRGRRGFTNKHRWEALSRMHQLWSLFNFLEGGSPCRHSSTHAVVNRASSGVWTSCHEGYARAMYKKILRYVSHPEGTLDRGTAKLNDLISRIQLSFYDPSITLDEAMSSAMPVNPNRISLPEHAGVLNPAEHLVGQQLEQFKRMHLDVPSKTLPGKKIKPCHKVLPTDWPLLLKKLHDAGMITFLPVEEVLHEDGKPIVGGLFCVPHKVLSDRLINDRRPLNQREERLGWSNLPAGHMLCQVILERGESIRCSGDDLSNYFYLIQHLPEWTPRNCFGTPVLGKVMPGVGLIPYKKYYPAFKVVCMGDTNGVDIAQAVHESVLKSVGCLSPAETLVYGKTFPASSTLEGLYIDDHLVFQILPTKNSRQRKRYRDEELLGASRDRYQQLNLPTSTKKAFQKDYDFKAWGTQVTSETGRVGTPYAKIRQIEALTCALVAEGWASKRALQKLLGLFIHPYMHRRELMAIFHHTYLFIEQLPENGLKRIPWYVKDELTAAALLLPFAEANIRTPVSVQISATDASSKMGGRASTITSRVMSKLLYRFAEKRGEHTRLDWDLHGISPPSRMAEAPPPVVDAMCKHCWTSSQSIRFDRKEHINILELEMVKQEIKARTNAQRGGCRVVNLCDSRVVVGAFAKGRSSSRNLNHKLRSCIPWLLASEIHLVNVWVPTDKNPADYPSRGKVIPEPPKADFDPLLETRDLKAVRTFRSVGVQQLLECEARKLGTDPVYENMDGPGVLEKSFPEISCCLTHAEETLVLQKEVHMHKSEQTPSASSDCLKERCDTVRPKDKKERSERLKAAEFSEGLRHSKLPQNLAPSSVPERGATRGFGGPKPKINMSEAFRNPALKAFREIFSGKGRLTEQVKRLGSCDALEPLEYIKDGKIIEEKNILNPDTFKRLKEDAKSPNQTWHFGMPCGSFSILQHSNKGTRRRHIPEGDGTLAREILGNELLRRTMILIDILEKSGNRWTLENPASSYLWHMPAMVKKLNHPSVTRVHIDQCSYGLRLRGVDGIVGPCKKPTFFAGTLEGLEQLERRCSCAVKHVHAAGGVKTSKGWKRRSELAGHYPIKLCMAYAKLLKDS